MCAHVTKMSLLYKMLFETLETRLCKTETIVNGTVSEGGQKQVRDLFSLFRKCFIYLRSFVVHACVIFFFSINNLPIQQHFTAGKLTSFSHPIG